MKNIIPLGTDAAVTMTHFELKTSQVKPGDELAFTFTLQNSAQTPVHLDIRYELLFPARDGAFSSRTYQIADRKCPAGFLLYNQTLPITEDILPSKEAANEDAAILLFPGVHPLSCRLRILVNGLSLGEAPFQFLL